VEFHLLGPVELWADGQRSRLGTAKERCVLAILLLTPGQPVPAETIIDRLWDENPPAKPRQSLYSYVTRLRERLADLGDIELSSQSGRYLLQVNEEAIDWHRFRMLRAQARAMAESGDDDSALELHRAAAQLWRAEPLADLTGGWVSRIRKGMEEELQAATLERIEIELRLGHHADLVGELTDLFARFPWVERFAEQLMVALFRCGRQAEALEVYRKAQGRLLDEVGTNAWPGLQKLHQRILRGDPALLYVPKTRQAIARAPNTLPRDIHTFTGRQDVIEHLMGSLPHRQATAQSRCSLVIAIDGMPGIGKTCLALHLAHRLAEHYPDGQLYVNLHAHDQGQEPTDPATVLDAQLRVMGVPSGGIPQTLDERISLWRSQLAHRRMLIVLDDAAGGEQILPLLPGSPDCLVIITSRRTLTGLDDVRSHSLDVLPAADAAELFKSVVGPGRPLDEHGVAEVAERCGYLPLALQLAGSRLRHRRTWKVADLLARLAQDRPRLEELQVEGREITAIFEMSYRGLSPRQQRAFRLCSLHPGLDFTVHTAAAILDCSVGEAERTLDSLLDRHLINEQIRGRYRYHDLLHEYAQWHAHSEDTDSDRGVAVHRVLDHYLYTADQVDKRLYPHRRRRDMEIVHAASDPPPAVATEQQAQSWLAAEHDNLLGVVNYAAENGWSTHVAQFAQVLAEYLETSGRWIEAARLHERALSVWEDAGDKAGVAHALSDITLICFRSGQYEKALQHAEDAIAIYRSIGDRRGEGDILDQIGLIHWQQSRYQEALACCQRAMAIRRAAGDQRGEAESLDHIAIILDYIGRYHAAIDHRQQALDIYSRIGDLHGQQKAFNNMGDLHLRIGHISTASDYFERAAAVPLKMSIQHAAIWLNNMAEIYQHMDRYDEALSNYREALQTYRRIGDRRSEIETLLGIGSTFRRMGAYSEALIHHQKALVISRDISERHEEARALRCIGQVQLASDRHSAALEHFQRALDLADQIGDKFEQAKAHEGIGTTLLHIRGPAGARKHWKQALKLYERLGVPEANAVRSYLREPEKLLVRS
jgi:tetratricopeptide (TPR) repeat protein